MDSLAFLERAAKAKIEPIYVLHGDEPFLKRQVKLALRKLVFGDDESGFGLAVHEGLTATYAAVMGDVQTVAMLTPRRLVIVDDADPFVSNERARLEKYVAAPSTAGVLLLDVQKWPSNTRLAKLVPDGGTIVCDTPKAQSLPRWCIGWCKTTYGKELAGDAAALLVELVGPEMGLLDQELAKLATYAGEARTISAADVAKLVGQGQIAEVWKVFDMIGAGQIGPALTVVDQLLAHGREGLALLGAFSMQLRRLVQAARLREQGKSLSSALEQLGVPPFARRNAEQQIQHLGGRRLDRIYDWLVEADKGMKTTDTLPDRVLLERLVIRLAERAPSVRKF